MLEYKRDEEKNEANRRKHGVVFLDAIGVFEDPLAVTYFDGEHSGVEDRFVTVGLGRNQRVLLVVHTDRGDKTRILSARRGTRKEQRTNEEGQEEE